MRRQFLFAVAVLSAAGVASAATVGETDRFLPLIHDGAGWSTEVTVTNLSTKPALAVAAFLTAKGFNEVWRPNLRATSGLVRDNIVEMPLAPGASAIIETGGVASTLTRGFAEVAEIGDLPIGVFATLTQREGDRIVQSLRIPLSPAHERRSVMPLDLTQTANQPQLIWVSPTSSTALDLVFRDLKGEVIHRDQLNFDGRAQLFVDVREQWKQLKDFRGTMEWTVSFPFADRYEQRFLSALLLHAPEGRAWAVQAGLTLPADQASISPY